MTQVGIKIIGISGSLRTGSLNSALLREAVELRHRDVHIEIVPIGELPLFNADVEAVGLPEPARQLRERIRHSDGILIATPEYNFSVPGVLKNAIDWISRPVADPVVRGKPVAIMGAGGRLGTARAQAHLRQICTGLSMLVLGQPEFFLASAWERFDANGRLADEPSKQALAALLDAFARWIALVGRDRVRT
ncbi:MAG TPA: NAD(P)H-dependent oxidoreductase [Acetobacteraceae bacterium]|jgi:chromate reductase|nr:NAD(P)H-dependent oxidoreductase [Acetobacteraceae bacterium]